jgi:ABC-2 type transport system permease protein
VNKLIFPLEKVLFELLNFALSLIAVAGVMIFFGVMPTANILLLPLLLLYVLIFCAGLCFILSALTVFFRDVIHLWSVAALAWMYCTPLFYPITLLEDWMQRVMQFNPMYHYVTYFREIALWHTTPSLAENLLCLGMALVTFALGFWVFHATQKKFILYV